MIFAFSEISERTARVSDHKPLVGQKALVTGANSGIGEAVAIALGQAGAGVVVNYVEGGVPISRTRFMARTGSRND